MEAFAGVFSFKKLLVEQVLVRINEIEESDG